MAQRQLRSDDTSIFVERFGNGADGAKTVSASADYDGANAGCSGTSGGTSLTLDAASTFANGDVVLIHQTRGTGVGNWELNKIASGGGGTSLTMSYDLVNTYTDSGASQAQILELKQYSSVTVNTSQTWSAPAWDGNKGGLIGFLCAGAVSIVGSVSASGKGYLGASAISGAGDLDGKQGEGTAGARDTTSLSANGNGGGGGNGDTSFGAGGGGGGGHSSAGSNGATAVAGTGGTGGSSVGSADLVTADFGGAGGSGGHYNTSDTSGSGGNGGGFVFIVGKTITVTGSVVSNGANGGNANGAGGDKGGGGAGAGGPILLKGQVITLGSSLVTASAGSGGSAAGSGGTGGNGSTGRIHADYSGIVSGTTSPTIDSRQDGTLADSAGMFLFNMT